MQEDIDLRTLTSSMISDVMDPDSSPEYMDESTDTAPFIHQDAPPLSKAQERVGRMQFLALCWSLFVLGWNDGSTGPLLHRISQVYDVKYDRVSWIFVFTCAGIVFGALVNMPLNDRYGLGRMLVFGSLFQTVAFAAQAYAPPFPLFVVSFAIGGIGIAIQDAQGNGFIATVKRDGELKMGFLQAAWGVGALIAPLSATPFSEMTHWSFHYLISLALSISNTLILTAVFRYKGQDECLIEAGETVPESSLPSEESKYSQLLRLRAVHFLALFLILYIGVEVTIGEWIVVFILEVRGGGHSSGYVASGFFGGLTLGRVVLIGVNQKLGEVLAIFVYTSLALLFELLVWLVPSFTVSWVAVFFIGILLGPMYPIAMRHAARVIPRQLVTGAIGWIAACGAAGSALLPFLTGTLASWYGIESLQPFLLVMMVFLGIVWSLVPKKSLPGQE